MQYGVEHYQQHSTETSSLLGKLFEGYKREGLPMPYTMADFRHDYVKEHLKDLTLEERLGGLSPEELVEGLSPDQIDQFETFLRRRKQQRASPKRKKKR